MGAVIEDVRPSPAEGGATALAAARRPLWLELARTVRRATVFATRAGIRQADPAVPRLRPTPLTLATVMADELVVTAVRVKMGGTNIEVPSILTDLGGATEALRAGGYTDDPRRLHPTSSLPTETRLTTRRILGVRFEHLSFPSCYEPPPGLPRREQWLDDEANHRAHAYLIRHDDRPRPWVVVLHGHRQGEPLDLILMGAAGLARRLGVNVLHPVLPLHGPRGRTSTFDPFPSIDPLVNFYGLSQAMWDVRQAIAWARAERATDIGVHGASLGGHTAALLASIEPGLACVVAGIPTADLSTMLARHMARMEGDDVVEASGVLSGPARAVNDLVSPLSYSPLLDKGRLFIYAGVGDRMTTPQQAVTLWRHWGEPRIHWVQCGHIGAGAARSARRFIDDALRSSGVVG